MIQLEQQRWLVQNLDKRADLVKKHLDQEVALGYGRVGPYRLALTTCMGEEESVPWRRGFCFQGKFQVSDLRDNKIRLGPEKEIAGSM